MVVSTCRDTASTADFTRFHASSAEDEENLGLLFFVGSLALVYTAAWFMKERL